MSAPKGAIQFHRYGRITVDESRIIKWGYIGPEFDEAGNYVGIEVSGWIIGVGDDEDTAAIGLEIAKRGYDADEQREVKALLSIGPSTFPICFMAV